MKIAEPKGKVKFGDLKPGTVFINDSHDRPWIKIVADEDDHQNAIDLSDGAGGWYNDKDPVLPKPHAELTLN